MAVQFPNIYNVEITKGPAVKQLSPMFYADKAANRIGANLFQNGQPYSPGGSCAGTAVLSDGTTVALTGIINGNQAYVDLTQACYSVPGPIRVFVSCVDGSSNITTVVAGFGNVTLTETGTIIDPGTIIPSVSALIADIDAAVASIPEDYSTLSGMVDALTHVDLTESGYISGTGAEVANSDYRRTGYIPVASDSVLILEGFFVGSTAGSAYAYYFYTANQTPISGANSITSRTVVTTIPSTAAYVRFSSRISQGETPVAYVSNHVVEEMLTLSGRVDAAQELAANAMQGIAPVFASTAAYFAGNHVWYRGLLYRFTADHAAGDWTGTDAEEVKIGAEVADLKNTVLESAMLRASASGAPAHFTDGAAMPIQKINVSIMPTQSGSGDPSGTNIRAISGYTSIRLRHYAKNYNGDLTARMSINNETGQTRDALAEYMCHTGYIPATKKVYINAKQNATGFRTLTVAAYDAQKQYISTPYSQAHASTESVSLEITLPENTAYIRYSLGLGSGTLYYVYTDYERAITAVDVPATPGTIYAGELVLNGDGSGVFRARPYYASYNGETLVGPWISDRDVYAAGSSPTTGAQVVDLGGAVTEYSLDADETREIITLYGENYIAANGDTTYTNNLSVTAEYYATPELYVDQHLETYAGMIGPDEGDTATENHAVGALIRSGHTLYRATASIAVGEEFVPGTNVTETTVNAEIARIWAEITA